MDDYTKHLNQVELDYDEEAQVEGLQQISEMNRRLVETELRQEYNDAEEAGAFGESQNVERPEPSPAPEPEATPSAPQGRTARAYSRPQEASPTPEMGEPTAETPEAPSEGEEAPQKTLAQQRKEELENNRIARKIPVLRELDKLLTAAGTATGDTLFDLAGKLGFQGAEDWWEKYNPSYHNEADQTGREILSLMIPTLVGGGVALRAGGALATASGSSVLQGTTAKVVGGLAAEAGIDVLVTGVSDVSERDENMAGMLAEHTGITLPWATLEGDSPDIRRKKNVMEAGLFTTGISAIQLISELKKARRATQLVPRDEAAAKMIDDVEDPVSDVITTNQPQAVVDEAGEVVEAPPAPMEVDPRLVKTDEQIQALDAQLTKATKEIEDAKAAGIPLDSLNDGLGPAVDERGLAALAQQRDRLVKRRAKLAKKASAPIESAMEDIELKRGEMQTAEGKIRLADDMAGEAGTYDEFINNVGDNNARAVMGSDASPKLSQIDTYKVQNNAGTNYGRVHPVATEHFLDRTLAGTGLEDRRNDLEELFSKMAPQFDAWRANGEKITAEMINDATDKLVDSLFFGEGDESFDAFISMVDSMKRDTWAGQAVLSDENFQVVSGAIKKAFQTIYDPNNMRASALLTQQAAGEIADIGVAARIVDNAGGIPKRQIDMALKRMEVLASEVRAVQYARGKGLANMKLARGKSAEEIAQIMNTSVQEISEGFAKHKKKTKDFMNMMKSVNETDGRFLLPLLDIWTATDGKVDSLASMFKYAEKRAGVIGKAFVDGEPQVPSVVVQGLKSTHYNNILNGLAPLRAAIGNTTMIAVKPATAMMGTALMKGDMRRALYQYSGFTEAFQRGLKGMSDTWRRTVANPELMGMTAREFQSNQIKDFEFMELMAQKWMEDGDLGRVAAWNLGKMLSWWNGRLIQNWGVSALSAIDGFTNAFVASASARARAYDEMFEATGGMMDPAALDKAQKKIYKTFFDEDGIITDSAVAATTKEITMQLDNKLADGLTSAMDHVPAIRGLFMFPKTGLNALEVAWSFNPVSGLGGAVGRVRKVMAAQTTDEMMDALRAHGINEFSQPAFDALKGEYIGRQIMGATVVTGAGLLAVNGMLTGSGPQDKAQNRRMREMGWKPYSIKNPITGEWRSYQGLEPFDSILGLTADAVYHATRLDQRIYEDTLRKIGFAISMNITNKTFMSGLEPLTALSSTNDEGAWARFFAMQTDALIPGTGIRSALSKVITPQLKDVERDFLSTLANRNKWMFKDEATLIDYRDFYTGKPVNGAGSWVEAVNRAMPIMRLSGGDEPWRQWLLGQGWDNLHVVTANPNMPKGTPITPRERQFIHDYVSKNNLVVPEIEKLMQKFGPDYSKKYVEQAKAAGHSDKDMPLGENYVHVQLDKIHRRAVKQAWEAMEKLNPDGKYTKAAEARRKKAAKTGQTKRAADEATTLKKSLERDQQTLKALIEF